MALKKFRPITPSLRFTQLSGNEELTKKEFIKKDGTVVLRTPKPEKTLLESLNKTGGRNNLGRVTMRHCAGGHKRVYRKVDFKRSAEGFVDVEGVVDSIQYDPCRTARIALVVYPGGLKQYIIAPKGLVAGDKVISYSAGKGDKESVQPGVCMTLEDMRIGSVIHNVELRPGAGAALLRSAGTSGQLVGFDGNIYAIVKLMTGEVRKVPIKCRATLGIVSNIEHNLQKLGKAGRKRWMGIRPTVRGVAMNPIDHPHGGGEGKAKGCNPVSKWGVGAKGTKTRHKKKGDSYIVQKRKRK